LLDPQQPVFAVASTIISQDEAQVLLNDAFPNYRGAEYKFSNIIGTRNESGLRLLGDSLTSTPNRTFTYVMDKKFAAFTKMVDFLIEPLITDAGYNFYAAGFCKKYTNYIYVGVRHVNPVNLYDELVSAYMTFCRLPSAQSLDTFGRRLVELEEQCSDEVWIFLDQMITGAALLTEYEEIDWFRETNEVQFTTMLASIGRWRQIYNEDFSVYHDNASNFLRRADLWEAVTNPDITEQLHPLGDGTNVQFPLRVVETHGVDSRTDYSIQLCDLLAGVATRYFKLKWAGETEHPFIKLVEESGLGQLDFSGLMFEPNFPDGDPQPLNGQDVIDQFVQIAREGRTRRSTGAE